MNSLERAIKEKIKYYMRGNETPFIVEIGAHQCEDTVQWFEIFEKPSIISFEPVYENYIKGLERICNFQSYYTKPFLFNVAISDKNGLENFYNSSNDSLSGSLIKPALHKLFYPDVEFDEGTSFVKCVTLDDVSSLLGFSDRIDLLFMDVQGAELKVIKGAKEILKNTRFIYTEYSVAELYSGAPNLEIILEALGPEWELCEKMWVYQNIDGNALLRRK
jgi:FkbM family methyltransferase